jgi:hypothetical protein
LPSGALGWFVATLAGALLVAQNISEAESMPVQKSKWLILQSQNIRKTVNCIW